MANSLAQHINNAIDDFKRNIGFYCSYLLDNALIAPDILQITLTYRCNLKCRMCHIKNITVEEEIASEKVISLIDEAAQWGIKELLLLGGEPFLHKNLMEFVRYAAAKNLKTTIVTNAVLINELTAKEIADSPLSQLVVSLDGSSEATHDSLRGVKGAYRKVIKAIKAVDKYKKKNRKKRFDPPFIIIPMTLMNNNLDEVLSYVRLGNRLPVSAVGFQPVVIDNADLRYNDITHPAWIPPARLRLLDKMMDKLKRYKITKNARQPVIGNTSLHLDAIKRYFRGELSQEYIKCYIGYTRVVISPDGNTSICGESIGNVNQQTMRQMWYSETAGQLRAKTRKCARPCLQFCTVRPESEPENALALFVKNSGYCNCAPDARVLIVNRLQDKLRGLKDSAGACGDVLEKQIGNIISRINGIKEALK